MKKSIQRVLITVLAVAMLAIFTGFASAAGGKALGAATVTASDCLNLRSSPDGAIIGTIPGGAIVVIYDNKTNADWYKVNYQGAEGYVSSDYLTEMLKAENFTAEGVVNGSYVRMRSGPSTGYDVLETLDSGEAVQIIGINDSWFKIVCRGQTGYTSSEYITIGGSVTPEPEEPEEPEEPVHGETETFTDTYGEVTGDYVRFRTNGSLTSTILFTLDHGTKVECKSLYNKAWYNVGYNGYDGFMSADYIRILDDDDPSEDDINEEGYVSGNYVNFRSGPSTDYAKIATLGKGTAVTVLSKAGEDGDWYKLSYNGKIGYMYASYITLGTYTPPVYSSVFGEAVAQFALKYVGYDYVYGGAAPYEGFDCSGLVKYVYETGFGIEPNGWFPHGATSQWNSGLFYQVARSEVEAGDLVYFSDGEDGITHIGIYIGGGEFVHASSPTVGVIVSDFNSDYYTSVFYGAQRLKEEYIPEEYK